MDVRRKGAVILACSVAPLNLVGMVVARHLAGSRAVLPFLVLWSLLMCAVLGTAITMLWRLRRSAKVHAAAQGYTSEERDA